MNTNAPEKIYVADITFPDHVDFDGSPINTKRIDDHDVEYIRADAFIEKACEWFKEHKEAIAVLGFIPYYYIENFRNYMKGE